MVISGLVHLINGTREANKLVLLGVEGAENWITGEGLHADHRDGLGGDVADDAEDLLRPRPAGLLLEDPSKTAEADVGPDRRQLHLHPTLWLGLQNDRWVIDEVDWLVLGRGVSSVVVRLDELGNKVNPFLCSRLVKVALDSSPDGPDGSLYARALTTDLVV